MARISTGSTFRLHGRRFRGLSGFDGKPFHPPLTDVPIGAYVIAPVLDIISFAGRNRPWAADLHVAAGAVFAIGALVGVFTALTGFADWLRMRPGSEVRRMANAHALTMVFVTVSVIANLLWRVLAPSDVTTAGVMALSITTLALVLFGGMIGGALVYDEGFNVLERAPTPAPQQQLRRAG